ncbi:L-threonine 3-dehydrogenase [Wolbachia endosymbiont of Pentalonia nigronervosa]|nr:L-threonine 3-dehydrogenase [Wolbachia endosymbiont of Pentalonia nigronervosa]
MHVMKSLCKSHPKQGLWLNEKPIPTLAPNEVLIKVRITGLCGTDLHIYNWNSWAQGTIALGLTPGHEFVGEVVKCGSLVQNIKVGERVTAEGHIFCKNCILCSDKNHLHLCTSLKCIGITTSGAFAEYIAVSEDSVIKIPDNISDEIASILDPLGNSIHCATIADCKNKNIIIIGGGPAGLFLTAILKYQSANRIIVIEPNEYRRELAQKIGATIVSSSIEEILKNQKNLLESITIGYEMSGSQKAFENLIEIVRPGGIIGQLGILKDKVLIDVNTIVLKGLTIKGIYGRLIFDTWHKMFEILTNKLDVTAIITHIFPAQDFQKAFNLALTGQCGKVLIRWDHCQGK